MVLVEMCSLVSEEMKAVAVDSELMVAVEAVSASVYKLLIDPLIAPRLLVVILPVLIDPEFIVETSASWKKYLL